MEVVINIPQKAYEQIIGFPQQTAGVDILILHKILQEGKVLPAGHGRLVDADEVMNVMERSFDMQDLYLPIHFKQFALDEAQTIVEADKKAAIAISIEELSKRKTGKWIITARNGALCSECKSGTRRMPMLFGNPLYKYCPLCGTKMDGAEMEVEG